MTAKSWEVYIILTKSGKLYTGITNDLERRFIAHEREKRGARFFHFAKPEKIVFREKATGRSQASKRESAIKKMSRAQKLALIEEYASHDKDSTSGSR